jgi:hypothetical protein
LNYSPTVELPVFDLCGERRLRGGRGAKTDGVSTTAFLIRCAHCTICEVVRFRRRTAAFRFVCVSLSRFGSMAFIILRRTEQPYNIIDPSKRSVSFCDEAIAGRSILAQPASGDAGCGRIASPTPKQGDFPNSGRQPMLATASTRAFPAAIC